MRFQIQLRHIAIRGRRQTLKLKKGLAGVRVGPRMWCDGYVAFRICHMSIKRCKYCLASHNQDPTVGVSHPTMILDSGRKNLSHNSRLSGQKCQNLMIYGILDDISGYQWDILGDILIYCNHQSWGWFFMGCRGVYENAGWTSNYGYLRQGSWWYMMINIDYPVDGYPIFKNTNHKPTDSTYP